MNEQSATPARFGGCRVKVLGIGGLMVAGALLLAACGGGGKSAAAKGMGGMVMPSHAGTANNAPIATTQVDIKNFAFNPRTITVTSGSTVVWTNEDSIQHDVTFDGGAIVSPVLGHNDTFSHTFATPGTYQYICSIHPFMHGTVVVTG